MNGMEPSEGYLCRCTVCGREERSGPSPLTNGWPKCCGYTMRLEDNERFKADIDQHVADAFGPLRPSRNAPDRREAPSPSREKES